MFLFDRSSSLSPSLIIELVPLRNTLQLAASSPRPMESIHCLFDWYIAMLVRPANGNKKLSWCWQTRATWLEVSEGHQTYHSIC